MIDTKKKTVRRVVETKWDFMHWFPELDICPTCKRGRTIFDNFNVKKITIEVEGLPTDIGRRGDMVFIYKAPKKREREAL